ncbi:MAG: non-ribosomal peptide synthetase [Pedosphaera sp.]|nr:non-ribosomal peptide synthetase [Pedosphaera sp.]
MVLNEDDFTKDQKELLALLLGEGTAKVPMDEPIIARVPGSQPPLSHSQERLWFLDQMEPESALFNIPAAIRLRGNLNTSALERSLSEILRRHEILRTSFPSMEGHPKAVVAEPGPLNLPVVIVEKSARAEREQEVERLSQAEAATPFDLAKGPLVRVKLLRLESSDHVLLITMHHIISDGWSRDIFYHELATLYKFYLEGGAYPLPDLPIQYGDFAIWQRKWLEGEIINEQLVYWREQLKGPLPILELATDRARPKVQSHRGGARRGQLTRALSKSLAKLGQKEGVTLFMLLLAAFKVLLHRYTGLEDVIVGSPVTNRNRTETEGLIGFFVNTLALRTDLSGAPTFREVLERVKKVSLAAYENKDLSFEKLVEELNPDRSLCYSPLFQVMFLVQKAPLKELKLQGLELQPMPVDEGTAKFDVTLCVTEFEDGLASTIEYNTDLFDAGTIDRMLEHYEVILEGIVSNPAQRISDLPLLTAGERYRLLVEWNDTRTPYPRGKTIQEVFEEQARERSGTVAVSFGNKNLTYQELNAQANQMAHYLRRLGVRTDTLVGICIERSLEMIVALLGILKAGGAYVSLDPNHPKERLRFLLEDAKPSVLLTLNRLQKYLPESPQPAESFDSGSIPKLVCVDRDWKEIGKESVANPRCQSSPESLAYVCFTSGSTGRPKGVCVPHRGVVRLVKETNYVSFSTQDTFLQLAPISFDASTFEIWGCLLNGAHLKMFPTHLTSLSELGAFIQKNKITTLWLTAGLFHQMVEEQLESLKGVRQLLAGGDVLSVAHVRKALAGLKDCRLINGYGPTENTTFTCCHTITGPCPDDRSISIGRPIANTQCYVLDSNFQPVPIGVYGELYASGDGLAQGYLRRPELTMEKFMPNPFTAEPGSQLYRTGDLVRYLPDGCLEFCGRADLLVKIRGFRVELGEIEVVLNEHPSVRECVVMAREAAVADKQLVAYIVAGEKSVPMASDLRSYLKEKLPDYMVPSTFVFLETLPLMPNGKVDRHKLPVPDRTRPELEKGYVPPRNPVEAQLTRIWEELLGIQPIGVQDKFFDLGGHSLLAVRLFAQIEKNFGKKLALTILFQTPTIEQLANALRTKEISSSRSLLVAIQDKGSKPPLFLIHGAGGGILWGYANLAVHFDENQPIYGIESPGMRGLEELVSIEEMASRYVEEIQNMQPRGPYYLGGYCYGGNVAYEMARQLHEQHEEVALLALFESMPIHSSYEQVCWWRPGFIRNFVPNIFYWLHDFHRLDPAVRRDIMQRKIRVWRRKLGRKLIRNRTEQQQEVLDLEGIVNTSQLSDNEQRLWRIHLRAVDKYISKPYSGRVTLFRTRRQPLLCSFDPGYGWSELASAGITVKIIPGSHESIFKEPDVRHLAEQLQCALREAQEGR